MFQLAASVAFGWVALAWLLEVFLHVDLGLLDDLSSRNVADGV